MMGSPLSPLVLGTLGLLGLCVGSFVTVIVARLPVALDEPNEFGETTTTRPWAQVLAGRSRCDTCAAPVRARHNLPVVSWVWLRGRCAECGARIPAMVPLIEAGVAVAWIGLGWGFGADWRLLPVLIAVPAGVALAAIDAATMIVPTRLVWPTTTAIMTASLVAAWAAGEPTRLLGGLVCLIVVSGTLFITWFCVPHGMGFGDVRLAVPVGWLAGFLVASPDRGVAGSAMAGLLGGFAVLAAAAGIGLVMAAVMRIGRGRPLPFGPALIGAVVAGVLLAGPLMSLLDAPVPADAALSEGR